MTLVSSCNRVLEIQAYPRFSEAGAQGGNYLGTSACPLETGFLFGFLNVHLGLGGRGLGFGVWNPGV